jgi:spore maturation protein CgeB
MGEFSVEALKELDHEVELFNFSPNVCERAFKKFVNKYALLNTRFIDKVNSVNPDLVLIIFGFDVSIDALQYLNQKNIVVACWWLNDPFQFDRSLKKAKYYDLYFTNSMVNVEAYKASGVEHVYWLPTACSPKVHKKVDSVEKYKCDICFAGDWSLLREQWCLELSRHFDLKIFGPWKKKISKDSPLWKLVDNGFFSPKKMTQIFSSSKVVFNIHSWYGKYDFGTNPRLFEAAGCGSCQVVDWKKDIEYLFDIPSEVLTYKDKVDMVNLVENLLKDSNKRRLMGQMSQQHAYKKHSYKNRMQFLLSNVSEYKKYKSN